MTKHWSMAELDKLVALGREGLLWRDVANRIERPTENCRSRFGQVASAEDKAARIAAMLARGWLGDRPPAPPEPVHVPAISINFQDDPAAKRDFGSSKREIVELGYSATGCAAAAAVNFCF